MSEKRIHFKGRGKTEKPTCPTCNADLSRSYESFLLKSATETEKATWSKRPYGWHCKKCKFQRWD